MRAASEAIECFKSISAKIKGGGGIMSTRLNSQWCHPYVMLSWSFLCLVWAVGWGLEWYPWQKTQLKFKKNHTITKRKGLEKLIIPIFSHLFFSLWPGHHFASVHVAAWWPPHCCHWQPLNTPWGSTEPASSIIELQLHHSDVMKTLHLPLCWRIDHFQ